MDLDEPALIRRCKAGDTDAFGSLVAHYEGRVFNAVLRMTGRREDAADIVQETFLKAFRAMASFREDAAFYTWLFQIAVNTVMSRRRKDVVRKQAQHVSLEATDAQDPPLQVPNGHRGPERLAQDAELGRRIEQAINELDDEYRLVVVLKDIEGCDYQQIADMIGCAKGTVKSRLHRARLLLRAALADWV